MVKEKGLTMRIARTVLTVPALAVMLLLAVALQGLDSPDARAQSSDQPGVSSEGPVGGAVPGNSLGTTSSADQWRAIRDGLQGSVSIPDKKSGVLIQSGGENWRSIRNGPLMTYGSWILLGTIILLAVFYLLRGRIRLEKGPAGIPIERFGALERFVHWMTAVSFILLALTGINVLWGRHVLLPVVGPEAFTALTIGGKYVHNFIAFPFMLGVLLMFVLWVGQNIPNRYDLVWFAKGGGMFSKHSHPPARKFNGGQKIIFWAVVLGGLSLSISGIALMFPFEFALWEKTFAFLNIFGAGLPESVPAVMEMQLSNLWHAILGLVMIAIILAHIYIGTLGMEGAFAAMGSGYVDENWAREHHNIWVEEMQKPADRTPERGKAQPAE